MAKSKKSTVSYKNIDHGKELGSGTAMHMKKIMSHPHKPKKGAPGKMRAGMMGKVEGHIDSWSQSGSAEGHDHGSRGPFKKKGTGHHKAK